MLFQGEFFTEMGEIGNQGGLRTLVLRGAQGGIVVYKEIGRESVGDLPETESRAPSEYCSGLWDQSRR